MLKENIPTCFTFPLLIQTHHNWIRRYNLVVLSIVLPSLQGSTETLSCSDFIFSYELFMDKNPNQNMEKPDRLLEILVALNSFCSQNEDFSRPLVITMGPF